MIRAIPILCLMALSLSSVRTHADKSPKKPKPKPFQAVCPVMGTAAVKTSSIPFKGGRIYFCCPGCPDQFDPTDKDMVTKAHLQLFATGQIAQIACPLKGHDLDSEVSLVIARQKVLFCCPGCVKSLKKLSVEKQIAAVFGKIDKTFTFQTRCPVTGKPIDPDTALEHKGRKVYFHNSAARKTFQKSPEKYLPKLPKVKSIAGK